MYHSRKNPLHKVTHSSEEVHIPKGIRVRRLHKAFLRYHDAENWPLLREALKAMGRADLIGNGKHHLIPTWQPATDGSYQSARRKNSTPPGAGSGKVIVPQARGAGQPPPDRDQRPQRPDGEGRDHRRPDEDHDLAVCGGRRVGEPDDERHEQGRAQTGEATAADAVVPGAAPASPGRSGRWTATRGSSTW